MMHHTFSAEVDVEDIRELLHEDLRHLKGTYDNLEVLRR